MKTKFKVKPNDPAMKVLASMVEKMVNPPCLTAQFYEQVKADMKASMKEALLKGFNEGLTKARNKRIHR